MLRIIRLILAVLAATTIMGWPTPVMAAGEGVISGQLVNKTANGSPVNAVEVTLITYFNGEVKPDEKKVTTNAAGKFEFKDLSTDNGTTYTVGAIFQEASYTSAEIALTATSLSQAVELDVYDSTTSDEKIQVSNGHMVVYVDQGDFEILEIWRFSNTGDKAFIGTQGKTAKGTLYFNLPSGATALSPGPGSAIETSGNGAISTVAVPPGVTDVNFSYLIPYQESSLTLLRKTDYAIASFSLLVQDAGVKVTSTRLTPGNPQMINGENFLYFTAGNLARGIDLDASFSGVVKPSAASAETFLLWPWLLAGVGVLGLVVAIAYPRLKKQYIATDRPTPKDEDELVEELARLDDAFEAGTIGEKEYCSQRAQLKADLMELYARSRESQ